VPKAIKPPAIDLFFPTFQCSGFAFFRVDEARSRRDEGYGLGLSIAKSLIAFHGGTVHVESEIGRGASFRVSFLRADVPSSIAEY
jgi:K+-sensing histidine kinase KdpD